METLASNHPWSDNLTVLGGNPQHKSCEDQTAVRKQAAPNSILAVCRDQNHEYRHVPWTHRMSLLDKADAAASETPASDAENEPFPDVQSTTSSMVAQPSYAATEPDDDNVADELGVNAERQSIDQLVKNYSRDAHDLAFMGEWHDLPELITVDDSIQPNEIHDGTIQQIWKNLAQKHDHVDGPWDHRLQLVGPTSSQSEPTLTDGSTVDSESIFSSGYPRDISTVSQFDQACRSFQSLTTATTVASTTCSQAIEKELVTGFRDLQVSHPPQHEVQRGSGGRGGSRRGRGGRGGHGHDASSSSNDMPTDSTQPTSEISSARISNDLKRRPGDEDDDHGAGDDNKEDRARAKRSKIVDPAKFFACPFEKREPLGTSTCSKIGFNNIPYLKQHLRRCHYRPVHCPVCGKTFKDRDTCDRHIQKRDCKPGELPGGISEDVQNRIEQRRPPKLDDKGHWFLLWKYIFPHVPPPLSPFKLAPWPEACNIFQAKFQKQMPILRGLLLSSDSPPLEPQIEGILKIFEGWISSLRDAGLEAAEYSEETTYGSSAEQEEVQTDAEDTGVLDPKGDSRQDPMPEPEIRTVTESEKSHIGQSVSNSLIADGVGWSHACLMSSSFDQGFSSFCSDLEGISPCPEDMGPGLEGLDPDLQVMGTGLEGMEPDLEDMDPSDTMEDGDAVFGRFLEAGGHPQL